LIKNVEGFPGLFAISVAGHTPGSTVYLTKINGMIWIFAGDIANTMADLLENNGKGWFYTYLLVPENADWLNELRVWLKELNDQEDIEVLVAHDLEGYERSGLKHWEPRAFTKPSLGL